MVTEDKSQLFSFSPEDEKEAQKELDRLRKRIRENENGAIHVNRKLNRKRTGFEDKTLWDWLQLFAVLAIPLILGIATLLFGIQQAHLADLQHQSDQKLAQQQYTANQQQALDQQRQATLVTYLDNMNNLLLNRGLLTSKTGDEIRVIARTETLSAMRQLDGTRNSFLVQFLQDAHLIGGDVTTGKDHNIVSFENADLSSTDLTSADLINANLSNATLSSAYLGYANLSNANLSNAYLGGATLSGATLSNADLSGATLSGAYLSAADLGGANLGDATLSGAYLGGANLSYAYLSGAYLNNANLSNANLGGANLGGADLSGANLTGTNLGGADLTQQQLDQVSTCKGATLPKGLTCHHNQ